MRSLEGLGAPGAGWNPVDAVAPQVGGGGFGALYGQLQAEVRQFIENGSGSAVTAPALSPEGLVHALRTAPGDTASPAEQQAFADTMTPLAREAASRLGVAPEVLVAHAALESGWGRQPLRRDDGSDAHNLFGIKAGSSWRGETVQADTTEFEAGQGRAQHASFRAYEDASASFLDLARLLGSNPRYRAALGTGSDAQAYGLALQRGGYATDPAYADKLARVTQRLQGGSR
ncbi:glycoside hydrolase family 73 protein [Roseateles sp. BYS78W]|uniref:Glycoside hydrolase family 73 protein n=1 Tax=Pelomonas candidula TaxID=3299025 RepID=A0ABW7HGJ8_9BURK